MPARTAIICKSLILFMVLMHGYFSHAQLKADFTAVPTSGCSPIIVKFTDISTGNPTSFKWDLGNGTISFLRNPSVTYFSAGQYNIKLIISNSTGRDSILKMQYITVYAKPVVAFSASATTGCFPLPVTFTNLSSAGSGQINKWEWDFGDGTGSTDSNAQHVYKTAGNFNVSLRVTNSFGCVQSLTKSQHIQINSGALAGFDIQKSNSCRAPANIHFTNTTTGTGALSYQWDFGDGIGSTLDSPVHQYTTDGKYTVRLIVKNSTGCTDTLTRANAIILGNTNAEFSSPLTVCQGSLVNINNISKPVAVIATWNFGDGTFSSSINPVKKYAFAGNYIIKMTVDFGACLDSFSRPITVLAKPVISFTADKTSDCKVPFTVNFTQNIAGATSNQWDFGDGTTSAETNPTHTYRTPGNFTVKLIAANAAGCSDTLIKPAFIKAVLPLVTIPGLPLQGCAPFTINLTGKVISSEPAISYQWDFGDGSTSALVNPSHTYLQPGAYTINVIITTAGGCIDTATVVNGVTVGIKPVVSFNADPLISCANVPVNFQDLSTGKIDKWFWQFGDGGTSIEQNPAHVYADTGYFNVTLIATNNGCADTLKLDRYIHINPPVAKFVLTFDCTLPYQRIFTDNSIGADTWFWDFGDSTTSTDASPVHIYSTAGSYTASLTVTNGSTGCSFTKKQTFAVIDEKANFKVSDSVICKGISINFETTNIKATNIASYLWAWGDGSSSASVTGKIAHVYKLAGDYAVTLIITDLLGCKDTLIKPLYIHVDGPTALFSPAITGSCLNSAVTFIDSSFSDGTHDIKQWLWNYGDGKTETLLAPPFQHSYAVAGIFNVSLKVTDSKGCTDLLAKPKALIISQPVAVFKTSDTLSCPQKPITFTNASTGPQLTYLWDFGDGSTSSALNPVHQYLTEGVFSVSLSLSDKYGCTGFALKKDYIKIVIPVAGFTMSDSISSCPPLVVNFTNTSLNAVSSSWDFGDGNISLITNPSHFYAVSGEYTVTLTVTSHGKCTNTRIGKIIVKGPRGQFNYTNIIGCVPLKTSFKASVKNTASIIWDFNDGTTVNTADTVLSHNYLNPGIYLPKIILIDSGGCHVPITGKDTIVVYDVRANFNSSSFVLCDSGAVKFMDNSVSNDLISLYQWSFGDGGISSLQNPVHTYKKSGIYLTKLIATTQSGCKDSLSIAGQVKVITSPKIAITAIEGACIPAVLNFSGKMLIADTSAISWKWDFGNGNTSTLQNPPDQVYPLANSYTIQLSAFNSSGCSDTVNKTVYAWPIPTVNITADSLICQGNSVNLSVQGASVYNWAPGATLSCTNCPNPIAKPLKLTQYKVKGTSIFGCVASDSISISVKFPFQMKVGKGDTLCAGSSTELQASGAEKYVWSPSTGLNNPLLARPIASPLQTTNYRVIASDSIGCFKDTGYVPVKVYPIPTVNAGEDKIINVGKTLDLIPLVSSDVTAVNWSPTSGIFRNSYPGISVKPNESLEYTVEVSNRGGCMARDRVTVNVLCNDANVFVPNTFSPNGDGANDIFYPRGSGLFQIKAFKIFNRWGEVVFEKSNIYANDISSGWDGMFKGKKFPPDVFVYIMDVVCGNNSILTLKGNIALVL